MPPKTQQKSKEAKAAAAMAGGKGKKKKWSKGRVRDVVQNKVLYDDETYEKMMSEAPKIKMITPSALVEKFKISGSLARATMRMLLDEGKIRQICKSHSQWLCTRATHE